MNHYKISPENLFVLRYIFWSLSLFGLVYFENFSPFIFLSDLQTSLTIYLTQFWIDMFDIPIQISKEVLIYTHGFTLKIVNECNGMIAFLLFLAAVFSYPTSIKTKLFWVPFSYFILLFVNTIRIDGIAYHVMEHPENFKFVHHVLGRYFMTLVPLILFYVMTRVSKQHNTVSFF